MTKGKILSKGEMKQVGCTFWRRGNCTRGEGCFYKHDVEEFGVDAM